MGTKAQVVVFLCAVVNTSGAPHVYSFPQVLSPSEVQAAPNTVLRYALLHYGLLKRPSRGLMHRQRLVAT